MELKECWTQLSEQVQQKIAGRHPGVPLDRLPKQLTDPDYWRNYNGQLTENEKSVLHWLAVHRGEDWLSFRELQGKDLPLLSVHFRLALTSLRQRGVVYAVRETWGETFYVLPADIREAWLTTVLTDEFPFAGEAEVSRLAPPGILHDLFHLLVMIDRDDVVLTGKAALHKRSVQKMNIELETPEEAFKEAEWLASDGEAVTSFHVVYRLAQKAGLLVAKAGQKLRLNDKALSPWLKQTHKEATHQLYRSVRNELLRGHPRYAAVLWWMEQQEDWVALTDMALFWTQQYGKAEQNWEAFAREWTGICLEPFHGLGWIDWGEVVSGKAWRWSAFSPFTDIAGDIRCEGYVQPNFEWLLPLHFPLHLRWRAAQFADLLQTDQMCTYDINIDSVKRGLENGWTAGEILRFLNEHSVTPVPQNVEASIRQWESQFGRVRLERVVLLTCHDKHLATELNDHPDIDGAIKRRLSETDFIVEEKEAERLVALLKEEGYNPVAAGRFTEADESAENVPKSQNRSRRVENRYPELEEAVPGLASLPKLWTSHLREYHASTLMQLVQRALDMQLELEWTDENAEKSKTFRPTRLINSAGDWKVEGVDPQDRVQRIQLRNMRQVRICVPHMRSDR